MLYPRVQDDEFFVADPRLVSTIGKRKLSLVAQKSAVKHITVKPFLAEKVAA